MQNLKSIAIMLVLFIGVLVFRTEFSFGETWNVSDLAELTSRLGEAATNGESDVINVASGTYNCTS